MELPLKILVVGAPAVVSLQDPFGSQFHPFVLRVKQH
jgi:hypothetical protein